MLGVNDLEFDQEGILQSSNGGNLDTRYLSSSVPFGFSIQDAIKELSLEDDGDVDTFLSRSTALLAPASPAPLPPVSLPFSIASGSISPSLAPLVLKTELMAEDDKYGSKDSLLCFIAPPRGDSPSSAQQGWETVVPSETDVLRGVRVRPSTTLRKSRPNFTNSDGTPIKSLKYMIHTPPRVTAAPGSLPSSVGSTPSFSGILADSDGQEQPYRDLHLWPELEDFLMAVPEWANCSICSELFDEPVVWPACEHVFCKSCITRVLNYGHRECPLCRGTLPNDCGFDDLPHSTRMASAMLLLPARCRWGLTTVRRRSEVSSSSTVDDSSTPSSLSQPSFGIHSGSFGTPSSSISSLDAYMTDAMRSVSWVPSEDSTSCREIVPLSSLPDHHRVCPYAPVRCLFPNCRQVFARMEIERHQQGCIHQPRTCISCGNTFSKSTLPAHLTICPEADVFCDCGHTCKRKQYADHARTTCENAVIACRWEKHGCSYVGQRKDQDSHAFTCPYEAVKGYIAHTEAKFQEYDRAIERLESMVLALRTQVHHTNPRGNTLARTNGAHPFAHSGHSSTPRGSHNNNNNAFSSSSTGPVGHGPRSGRFWDDDSLGQDSDDEFSIYL